MTLLDRERRRESSTQQDLVRVLGVDKSNVARLCAKMLEAGQLAQARPLTTVARGPCRSP
jgi:DNA-binding IclR family transcriptional regulator